MTDTQPLKPTDEEIETVVQTCRERGLRELDVFRAVLAKWSTPTPVGAQQADLPPLPTPDLRDVGTNPEDIKNFLRGYATEYAKVALAAHKQGATHD